jgi:hypothetical protein
MVQSHVIIPYASEIWILILLSYTSVHSFVAYPIKAGIREFTNILLQRKELLLHILKVPGSESNYLECGPSSSSRSRHSQNNRVMF